MQVRCNDPAFCSNVVLILSFVFPIYAQFHQEIEDEEDKNDLDHGSRKREVAFMPNLLYSARD
jgi:hypothetical protein